MWLVRMPKTPPRPCTKGGCTKYAVKGGRCKDHERKAWDHGGKTRQERGYGKSWEYARKQALIRDDYLCVRCRDEGVYTRAREVDHKLPKHLGGTDHPDNLESICTPHHKQKTNQEAIDARRGLRRD